MKAFGLRGLLQLP